MDSVPPIQPDFLRNLAEQLKRAAKRTPRQPVYPAQPLKNGAQLALRYENAGNGTAPAFKLRIARRGLSPLNQFNTEGTARLKAWRNEIKTFLIKFGVPAEAELVDGARELIYFVDICWSESEESVVKNALQRP